MARPSPAASRPTPPWAALVWRGPAHPTPHGLSAPRAHAFAPVHHSNSEYDIPLRHGARPGTAAAQRVANGGIAQA